MLKYRIFPAKSLNKIFLSAMIILVLSIAIPLQTATALIIINDYKLKFVVTFTRIGTNVSQITNFLNNQVFPSMQTDLINKLDANFINYTIKNKLQVFDQGNDRYQIYPKILFSGNTNLNQTQLKNGLDSTIDDWLTTVEGHMATQNATNVTYHIHKSFGDVNVNSCCL